MSNKLIPEATNRKTVNIIEEVSVIEAIAEVQIAVPGTACTVFRRTPPATAVTNVAEITIVVTATARKT